MEHIEEAGIHSGDSACSLPPYSLSKEIVERLKEQTRALAKALRVRGLMNVQYAIKDGEIYVIEVNPRARRTVPFVGKATGIPWAKIAAKVMAGQVAGGARRDGTARPEAHVSVKEVVFPFTKFPGVDVILGPEMRSTGEVMGIDRDFPDRLRQEPDRGRHGAADEGHGLHLRPRRRQGGDRPGREDARRAGLRDHRQRRHVRRRSRSNDIPATRISKLAEGRPNIKDYIKNGKVQLIINTPTKKGPQTDEGKIRAMAVLNKVPIVTTITGANAAAQAIQAMQKEDWGVQPLQEYFERRQN